MGNQEFLVIHEILANGCKAFNVVAYDGDARVRIHARSESDAERIAETLNNSAFSFDVALLRE